MLNSEKNGKLEVPIAVLSREGAVVSGKAADSLSTRGYGTRRNGKLVLASYETLFLVNKGIIDVKRKKSGEKMSFQDLLKYFRKIDKEIWVKFLIYQDLRKRGYIVREGFGLGVDFRLYERGEYGKEPAKNIIFGILEGTPISVKELSEVLRKTQNLKKRLILAVVDRRGEIVYYSLSKLSLGEVIEGVEF